MSTDNQSVKIIYVSTALIIILVILLLIQSLSKADTKYQAGAKIAIKTSQGIIKMRAEQVKDQLTNLYAELSRHEGYVRTSKYSMEIDQVLHNLRVFIEKNPGTNLCQLGVKTRILDQAMYDRITPHQSDQKLAHASIISHDELEYGTEDQKFSYLLRNIDLLIGLLKRHVCDNGMLDLQALEDLLRKLDSELTIKYHIEETPESLQNYYVRHELNTQDTKNKELSLFETKYTQPETSSLENHIYQIDRPDERDFVLGPHIANKKQQQSQIFRTNEAKLGDTHYDDMQLLNAYHTKTTTTNI